MVKYERVELIQHPLTTSLTGYRWAKLGRRTFATSFLLYIMYLATLTWYTFNTAPVNSLFYTSDDYQPFWMPSACNQPNTTWPLSADVNKLDSEKVCAAIEQHRHTPYHVDSNGQQFSHFVQIALLGISLPLAIGSAIVFFTTLRTLNCFVTTFVFALTAISTIPWTGFSDCFWAYGLRQSTVWQVSAFNIFLAYAHVALMLGYMPGVGIYVHMLKNVLGTMIRVLVASFGFVVCAFALSLHLTFRASAHHKQRPRSVEQNDTYDALTARPLNPFYNFPQAICKTLVMLISEFDMEDHFSATNVGVASVILLVLVLFGTIALMNLLIGLAIDDINALLDQAEYQQRKMEAVYVLNVERLIRAMGLTKRFKARIDSCQSLSYDMNGDLREEITSSYSTSHRSEKSSVQLRIWQFLVKWYQNLLVDGRLLSKTHTVRARDLSMAKETDNVEKFLPEQQKNANPELSPVEAQLRYEISDLKYQFRSAENIQ